MPKTLILHAYRDGAGATNLTANLSVLLAKRGARVGVIDANLSAPGLQLLFSITGSALKRSFNGSYLRNNQSIAELVYDASSFLDSDQGHLFVVPSNAAVAMQHQITKENYIERFRQASKQFIRSFDLDYLLIDTQPGIEMSWISVADLVLLVIRPDQQDFQGAAMLMPVLRSFGGSVRVILNQVPEQHSLLKQQIERTYRVPVAGVFEWTKEMAQLSNSRLFCLQFPQHPLTIAWQTTIAQIINT